MLNDVVEVLKMFPNKAPDAWIFWNCFFFAIVLRIACGRAAYGYVIDVRLSYVWYFGSKDVCDVVMEYRD